MSIGVGELTVTGAVTLTAKFYSPDGFTAFSYDSGVADCTPDGNGNSKEYAKGDKNDYGTLDGTILVDTETLEELNTMMTTRADLTLSLTYNVVDGSGNTTNALVTGAAFLNTLELNSQENGKVLAPASFMWKTKPTISNEAA